MWWRWLYISEKEIGQYPAIFTEHDLFNNAYLLLQFYRLWHQRLLLGERKNLY